MLISFLSSCPLPCLLMLHTRMDELADDKLRHDRSMNVAGWLETSDIFRYEFHLKRCLIRMKKMSSSLQWWGPPAILDMIILHDYTGKRSISSGPT